MQVGKAVGRQILLCYVIGDQVSLRRSHSHLDEDSAALAIALRALFWEGGGNPNRFNKPWTEVEGNPLQPTSMGNTSVFHPFEDASSARS